MKTVIHKASERGSANHGWLLAKHSFSFAQYYNPRKMNFGALRVLNDYIIEGGTGFGVHPHDNMEIITIPLDGSLKHKDSMSNTWIPLNVGEVQVMSAGAGIQHSEMNNLHDKALNLFQIWILPNKQNVTPHYVQKTIDKSDRHNKLQVLVSSIDDTDPLPLKIHQNAQISRLDLDEDQNFTYKMISENNGLYIMVIEGNIQVNETILDNRDATGIYETPSISLKSHTRSELLFIEVPMVF